MSVRLSRGRLVDIAVAVALVAVGFGAYSVGRGGSSPADVVRSYLDALERGDAAAALALGTAPDDRTLLTGDVLRQQQSLAPISAVRVLDSRTGSTGAVVRVRYRIGERTVTDAIELLRRGGRWALNHVAVDVELSALSSLPQPTVLVVAAPADANL
jgi:hypothetical protein